MIDVYARAFNRRKWEKVPNGPFPLTEKEFLTARESFGKEYNAANPKSQLMDSWVSTARHHLKKTCPQLSDFDLLCLGNAVAMFQAKTVKC